MTQRKISPNLKDVLLDQDLDQLYESKIELSRHNNSGSFVTITHPEIFTGRVSVSANGTSGIATNPAFPSRLANVRHAEANIQALGLIATVTDITASSLGITVTVKAASSALISSVTTASVVINWLVLGDL